MRFARCRPQIARRLVLPILMAAMGAASAEPDSHPPTVTVGGYIEAFYQLNFNFPSNLITAFRDFDNRSTSFTIENAALEISAKREALSALLVLQVGHAPAGLYIDEPDIPAQAGTGPSNAELWRLIQQAIIGYRIRKLETSAGIFLSPIGFESFQIKDQWNWSRSN